MAVNAYLWIDTTPGPSTSRTDCIDILSFSWGVSNTSTYGAGASGKEAKAGRADFSNLSIIRIDRRRDVHAQASFNCVTDILHQFLQRLTL